MKTRKPKYTTLQDFLGVNPASQTKEMKKARKQLAIAINNYAETLGLSKRAARSLVRKTLRDLTENIVQLCWKITKDEVERRHRSKQSQEIPLLFSEAFDIFYNKDITCERRPIGKSCCCR